MSALPAARSVARAPLPGPAAAHVVLRHDERSLRRRRLVTEAGEAFLADLPATLGLRHGDALALEDGRLVEVRAADEPLLEVRGDLPRLAWHIGNRHAPCQIEPDRLLIGRDEVLRGMLEGLGAAVLDVTAPFRPEGGAYGEGTPMGHAHGGHSHGDHGHAQAPDPLGGLSGLGRL